MLLKYAVKARVREAQIVIALRQNYVDGIVRLASEQVPSLSKETVLLEMFVSNRTRLPSLALMIRRLE